MPVDYLILSTIHSAKGQEWDVVYVLNAADGCMPSDMAAGSPEQIEEEVLAAIEMNAFKHEYQRQVIANAKAFARALADQGLPVVGPRKDAGSLKLGDVATTTALVKVSHDTSCREAVHKMQRNACRRLMVYRGDRFVGLVNLPSVAYALAEQSTGKNPVANVFVWLGVAVAVTVILIMLYLFPEMLHVAQDATGN